MVKKWKTADLFQIPKIFGPNIFSKKSSQMLSLQSVVKKILKLFLIPVKITYESQVMSGLKLNDTNPFLAKFPFSYSLEEYRKPVDLDFVGS